MTDRALATGIASVAAVGVLFYLLAPVLTPFLAALLLAYMGSPTVSYFERHGIPRTTTVILLFLLILVALLALALGLIPLVQTQVAAFAQRLPSYIDWVQRSVAAVSHGQFAPDVAEVKHRLILQWESVGLWLGRVVSFATHSGMRIAGWVLNLLLIPVLTFYLLRDWAAILSRLDRLLPPDQAPRWRALAREIDQTLAGFLRGQLSVMLVLGIYYAIGLSLVGLDLALPIALITGLLSFIPYLGFFFGLTLALLAALLQFHGALFPLAWVPLVFIVGHFFDSLVLGPRLIGHSIGLHPVVVIFAVMAGGRLFGFMGILLALPVSAILMVWMRHLYYGESL